MLVVEYYNGPMSGFIQCPCCCSVYYFFTVDWSQDQFTRVIALCPVPNDSMQRLVSFFSEDPKWPQWIPTKMQSPGDPELDRIEAFTTAIVRAAGPAELVVAWNVETNHVLAARRLDAVVSALLVDLLDQRGPRTRYDWFSDFRLSRAS